MVLASSVMLASTVYPSDSLMEVYPEGVSLMNFFKQLGMMEDYAKYAREALRDEHESNYKHYVNQLAGLAAQLKSAADDM